MRNWIPWARHPHPEHQQAEAQRREDAERARARQRLIDLAHHIDQPEPDSHTGEHQ